MVVLKDSPHLNSVSVNSCKNQCIRGHWETMRINYKLIASSTYTSLAVRDVGFHIVKIWTSGIVISVSEPVTYITPPYYLTQTHVNFVLILVGFVNFVMYLRLYIEM